MSILALDVGTSSIKAALLERRTGRVLHEAPAEHYPLLQPEADAAVLDPQTLWNGLLASVGKLAGAAKVEAIGFSVLSPGWLLLDGRDEPLTPIITHLDRRARPTARRLREQFGVEFLAENGNPLLPGGISGVVAAHLFQQHPELRARVRRYLHLNSWLALRLTGQTAMDPGNAAFSGCCAARTERVWSAEWCGRFGIDPQWLPPIADGRTVVGGLRPELASEMGRPEGTPVMLGIPDTSSAVLAANLQPGELLHSVGTTQVLAVLSPQARPAPCRLSRPLGTGPNYLNVTHNPVGGVALDWLRQLCFADQSPEEFFGPTLTAARSRPECGVKLDPLFLGGDRLEVEARSAAFQGLRLGTQRLDLLAALLRGMVAGHREARRNLETGAPPSRVVLTGGGAELMRDLLPDYAGVKTELLEQAALRGVARLFD